MGTNQRGLVVCTRCNKNKEIAKKRVKSGVKEQFCKSCWNQTLNSELKLKRLNLRQKRAETVTERKLDSLQSKVIRMLYGEQCCTCDKKLPFKKLHNGHFISRRFRSVRFNPQNCASQCPTDNLYFQGCQYEFGKFINKFHGEGTAERLIKLSKSNIEVSVNERKLIYQVYQAALVHKDLNKLIEDYYKIFEKK